MGNITSMMVLASIYLSTSTSLPRTNSIKPVEIWLLANLVFPFIVIITNILLQKMETVSVTSRVWLKQKVEDEHTDGKTERNKRKWKSNLINFAFYINPINYL